MFIYFFFFFLCMFAACRMIKIKEYYNKTILGNFLLDSLHEYNGVLCCKLH